MVLPEFFLELFPGDSLLVWYSFVEVFPPFSSCSSQLVIYKVDSFSANTIDYIQLLGDGSKPTISLQRIFCMVEGQGPNPHELRHLSPPETTVVLVSAG